MGHVGTALSLKENALQDEPVNLRECARTGGARFVVPMAWRSGGCSRFPFFDFDKPAKLRREIRPRDRNGPATLLSQTGHDDA